MRYQYLCTKTAEITTASHGQEYGVIGTLTHHCVKWYNHFGMLSGRFLWSYTEAYHLIQQSGPRYYSRGIKTYVHICTCTQTLLATLFRIAPNWKQSECLSTGKWRNRRWYVHTVEYYSAVKRNVLLIYVTTWMDLKNIVSKTLQTQKAIYRWGLLQCELLQWAKLI